MAIFHFPDHDCVFIHLPKTGGASIRHGFFGGRYEGAVHGAMPDEWRDKFAFTFVRNPFDRAISCWKMFTGGMQRTNWPYPPDGNRALSSNEFLKIAADETILYDERRTTFEEKIRHHAIPQTHPFNCLRFADFTGRFETLDADFARVCHRIGTRGRLPHRNATTHDEYRKYFDDETRMMAESLYREDLRELGYTF